jgi:hypothetical protein
MSRLTSSKEAGDVAELKIPLSDPADLFNAPPVAPLSRSPAEVLGVSGVEHLLSMLHMDQRLQQARLLTLLLPPEKAASVSAERTTRALHRHVEMRLERERRELRNTYRYGWKVTGITLLLLAVCLGLASVFTSDLTGGMRPLVRSTFEYGFEIIGWVLLWHPIDVLAFVPLAIRARILALQTLATVTVAIQADPTAVDEDGIEKSPS